MRADGAQSDFKSDSRTAKLAIATDDDSNHFELIAFFILVQSSNKNHQSDKIIFLK